MSRVLKISICIIPINRTKPFIHTMKRLRTLTTKIRLKVIYNSELQLITQYQLNQYNFGVIFHLVNLNINAQ